AAGAGREWGPGGRGVAGLGASGEAAAPGGRGTGDGGRVTPQPAPPSTASPLPRPPSRPPADATRVKASPLAKRIAKETGVDLKLLTGSGPGGRVVRRDLEAATARPVAAASASAPVAPVPSPSSPVPVSRGGAAYEDVPLTQIRKTIAKRLVTSLGPVPHFFLTTDVAMERASEGRSRL